MKDVQGYEGLYAITSCGKVWSYRQKKFMKPQLSKDGYQRVQLRKDNKVRTIEIHKLVAEAYLIKPEGKVEVNHKDEIKIHNYVNNLEWLTHKENVNYGTRNERARETRKYYKGSYKPKKPVLCIELNKVFESATDAARELQLDQGSICKCCRGKLKTTGKYHWKYI